jgi:hypothetical protein
MISSRRPTFTQNASSHSTAPTTKPATSSQPQLSDSTNLTLLSTSSPVPVTTSVPAATKSQPNAARPSVDTQKRVVCSNTRLSYQLPLLSVRYRHTSCSLRVAHPPPLGPSPTTPRTTHNTCRFHSSRRSISPLPLRYPRRKSLSHLPGYHKLYTRSPTRAPAVGGMDRPLCAG